MTEPTPKHNNNDDDDDDDDDESKNPGVMKTLFASCRIIGLLFP